MIASDLAMALDPALIMRRAGMVPDKWQESLLRSKMRQHLLLCSRQSGKSTTTASLAMHTAIYEAPALILLLSPSLRQSKELFLKMVEFYNALGRPIGGDVGALEMKLENGSRVVALPGRSDETIRGYSGVNLLIVDEASRVEDSLYYSIRPMLAVSGGRLVCLTTPFGKSGFFYNAWESEADWQRHRITAAECPRISAEFLAEEKAAMGDYWYSQEYECVFRDAVDSVFSTESIMAALSPDLQPLQWAGFSAWQQAGGKL